MRRKTAITYSIEQKTNDDSEAWDLVALHDDGWKRMVLTLPTKRQAQRAFGRLEAIMAAQDV
jgi:hypothetical protein